jgi:EmrB/QacA subfamily drug resistance transporter
MYAVEGPEATGPTTSPRSAARRHRAERKVAMTASLPLPDPRPGIRSTPHRRWTLIAVALATFMTLLDNNIINVAIPTIQRDLHLSESGVEWVVSAYILVFAGLLLAGGRLADVFGRKRLFVIGLSIFTLSSLVAGLSGDIGLLIASRAAQGLGAALLTPTTLAILTVAFPEPKEQAAAVGAWSAVGALALAVGPLLGGILSEDANWHWIFFINVPVGIVTLALGLWALPSISPERRSIDMAGLGASVLGLVALTYGLIEGPDKGWTTPVVVAALATSVVAGLVFVVVERRVTDPMVDLAVFADRTFTGAMAALMMWGFGLFGIYFFTSLYLQDVLGFSAVKAGLAFVPMAILMAVGAIISDRVAARVCTYRSVGSALVLMAIGMLSVSFLGTHAGFVDLMPGFVVIGIGGGLTIPLTSTVLGVMPADRAGVASALFNAAREVSGLLGITVIGVVLTARQSARAHHGASPTVAFLSGYRLGLVVAAALVACGGVVAWVALRRVPAPDPAAAIAAPEMVDA